MKALTETLYHVRDMIQTHGRVQFYDGALLLPWSSSGFTMRFVGSSISFTFLDYSTEHLDFATVNFKLFVDGVASSAMISTGREAIFANGLCEGEHTVTLMKVSESMAPVRVNGITVIGDEPKILSYRAPEYSLKLEFIGDSITCGYGVYGMRGGFVPYEEDSTAAYAALTAKALSAEYRLISWSGAGIVRSCEGLRENRFIDFFKREVREPSSNPHDFSSWAPDVLVINGGTNDQNSCVPVSDGEFEDGVRELYTFARSVYPKAKIVFYFGAMGHKYDGVYERTVADIRRADSEVFFFTTEAISPLTEYGANEHPNPKAHERIAHDLINSMKENGVI